MAGRRLTLRRRVSTRRVGKRTVRKYRSPVIYERSGLFQLIGAIGCAIIIFIFILIVVTGKKYKLPLEYIESLKVPGNTFGMLNSLSTRHGVSLPRLITFYLLDNYYYPEKSGAVTIDTLEQKYINAFEQYRKKYDMDKIQVYIDLFSNILDEIKVFPIPSGYDLEETPSYAYGESFGALINSKYEKEHTGTDIFDKDNIPGRIPVISMTNGTVKDIGWSNTYGYSVGIITENGNYYLYGHFDKFSENLVEGSKITAGRLLGYMGNTGYSSKKHNKGSMVTHMHIGIKVTSSIASKEFWINPYPFLRFKEEIKQAMTN